MYDILIKNDNSVVVSGKSKLLIVQHSSMVDSLRILVKKAYNEKYTDMSEFTAIMEYFLPQSKKHKTVVLDLLPEPVISDSGATPVVVDKYADYYKYALPIDAELTAEAGDVEIQFTFAKKTTDNYGGTGNDIIRKTDKAKITITPLSDWAEIRNDVFEKEIEEIITPIPSA